MRFPRFSSVALAASLLALLACEQQGAGKASQLLPAASAQTTMSAAANPQPAGHMRLIDPLDREDYYCLDIMGSGDYVRFDLPMTAHNGVPPISRTVER